MTTTFISLVDDHALLRSGLAGLINSFEGYKVLFEADNGKHFIDQIKPNAPPDIVLLDITMPVMNGYETAAWIRINLPKTKVLVLSMLQNDEAIISMLRLGAKGYLLKDSKPKIFREALNHVRDNGFYLNEAISGKLMHHVNSRDKEELSSRFTNKELQFLRLICTEKTYKEIAEEMCLSHRTVEGYRDDLFEKIGVSSRIGLVLYAIKTGIITVN